MTTVSNKTNKKKSEEKRKAKNTTESKSNTQKQKDSMVEAPAKKEKKRSRPKTIVARKEKRTSAGQKQKSKTTSSTTEGGEVPSGGDDKSLDKRTQKEVASEKKTKKKASDARKEFNMEMAQKFFRMMDSQKVPTDRSADSLFDTMPESSQMRSEKDGSNEKTTKAKNKQRKKKRTEKEKKAEEEEKHKIFKENGDPIWLVHEVEGIGKDGEKIKNPILMAALEEDDTDLQDGKGWANQVPRFMGAEFDDGKRDTAPPSGPFHSLKHYEDRENQYFQDQSIRYNTCASILVFCNSRFEQFMNDEEPQEDRKTLREQKKREMDKEKEKDKEKALEEKTCIEDRPRTVVFLQKNIYVVTYDRRKPIASIIKFRKKVAKLSKETAETVKKEKKKSRENH